jgi:alpha-glucosidase
MMATATFSWKLLSFSPLSLCSWSSLLFLLHTFYLIFRRRRKMAGRAALALSAFCVSLVAVSAQSSTTSTSEATTSYRPIFTVPAEADASVPLIPNIYDSEAVSAQDTCPGYLASNVVRTAYGLTASLSLAGSACNLYGTDIDSLNLTVEYQSEDRLHVEIVPTNVGPSNSSWYILPEVLVRKPTIDADTSITLHSDLNFVWSNDPTFSFRVIRQSTGDVLFDTTGTKLVFENQFIEFASALPENYNLYGLGEVIHGLRMGNNLTRTFWAADVGDPIDENIYGDHSFYLDTRYYQVNETTGNLTYAPNATDATADYVSYSHGVYMRNSHGQEVLLRPSNITWRTLGGSVDLYFYAGPTQDKVTKAYQQSAIGFPAMQQYFTFGYHQCRWGYANWSVRRFFSLPLLFGYAMSGISSEKRPLCGPRDLVATALNFVPSYFASLCSRCEQSLILFRSELQDVVNNFKKFGIPLENIWTDIDYMNQYRDFDNDQGRFGYVEGARFLSQLHENGQHYIPIVDSAIYVPNPQNASDAYPIFNRGNDIDAFMLNPDGSLYIGEVWPGYT